MKSFLRKLMIFIFIIVVIAAVVVILGVYLNIDKFSLDKWKPAPLVEQIPFEEDLEIIEFEEAEFYDSTNEFIGAEIRVRVKFISHIEPSGKLPAEYKRGVKKAYSNVDIHVKEIPSLEMLERMKEALAESKYLKLIKNEEVSMSFRETQIDNKKIKSIDKIYVKPENYYFVKY